jgi:recombinational DNA repair protein RecT
MTQVQLIIEDFFENSDGIIEKQVRFKYDYNDSNTNILYFYITQLIQKERCKDICTRQTIIEALREYQKSLLPFGYRITMHGIIIARKQIEDDNLSGTHETKEIKICDFYDPETRIVTITKFDKPEVGE